MIERNIPEINLQRKKESRAGTRPSDKIFDPFMARDGNLDKRNYPSPESGGPSLRDRILDGTERAVLGAVGLVGSFFEVNQDREQTEETTGPDR